MIMFCFWQGLQRSKEPEQLFSKVVPLPLHLLAVWTLTFLSITHTSYAALDINAGHIAKFIGKHFYFYHRYSEFVLHMSIGIFHSRPDHLLQAAWHVWKYIDVTAGGRVKKYPMVAGGLDWADAFTWLFSAWCFNATLLPFGVCLCVYAALLRYTWASGIQGNDRQGSITYGVSLMRK
jgi:hypothetical protein